MKKLNKILWIKFDLVKEAKEKFEDNYIEYIRENIYLQLSFGSYLALKRIRSEKAEDLMLQISQDSSHDLSYMAFEYLAKCENENIS